MLLPDQHLSFKRFFFKKIPTKVGNKLHVTNPEHVCVRVCTHRKNFQRTLWNNAQNFLATFKIRKWKKIFYCTELGFVLGVLKLRWPIRIAVSFQCKTPKILHACMLCTTPNTHKLLLPFRRKCYHHWLKAESLQTLKEILIPSTCQRNYLLVDICIFIF